MRLIDTLHAAIAQDDSPFRSQLLREDIARITGLCAEASQVDSSEALGRIAMQANWTASQARTDELGAEIRALSDAVFELVSAGNDASDALELAVERCWLALHHLRLERMLGCLSTPLPKPVG